MSNTTTNKVTMIEMVKANSVNAIVESFKAMDNKGAFKMIKQESKNLKIVGSRQIEISAPLSEEGKPYLEFEVKVNISLESSLTRMTYLKPMKLADNGMVLEVEGTEEIASVNLHKSLFKEGSGNNCKVYNTLRSRVFSLLRGGNSSRLSESLNMVISESGLARVELDAAAELKDGETMITYKFLGVSPSGLRSKSVMSAQVSRRNDKAAIKCDRRIHLLNESIDGCMDQFLNKDGSFAELKNKEAQFKNSTRTTMGAPGSQEIHSQTTYVVFDNIAEGTKFTNINGKSVSACDTRDGNITVCAEDALANLLSKGIPVTLSNVIGTMDQLRGAGLKCSARYTSRADMVTLCRQLLSSNSTASVAYIVIAGVRYTSWKEVVDAGLVKEFFNNVGMIADTNAMKLLAHRNEFKLVKLKMAYQSDMNLNLVTAMAMVNYNKEKATEVLRNLGIKSIIKRFAQLGVSFDYNDGCINDIKLDLEGLKSLNNEGQFMSYLLKCDPAKIMSMFPGVIRSEFTNMIKGFAKVISKSEFELEDSKYTVVQADEAVLYGQQVLAEDEMYCKGYDHDDLLSITRHPISALEGISTLRVVGLEEIVTRILAMNVSVDIKIALINYYGTSNGWCIIPASHRLMEKHDGMDFDIDAVQIIKDKEVVDILKEIPDRGSVIKDNAASNQDRKMETVEEKAITNKQSMPEIGFVRPTVLNSQAEDKDVCNKAINSVIKFRARQSINKIDLSFDQQCIMTEDYLSTSIASVGEIANAFYVNGLVLATLRSTTVEAVNKDRIVKAFKLYYGCLGLNEYKSEVNRSAASYQVDKADATAAVFRFAECNGSLHSLISYLEDCCDFNRYIAETSIDSAKNNFYIINMFNHSVIVAPKGAKHVCKAELFKANETFAIIANGLKYTDANFFGVKLLDLVSEGISSEGWDECCGFVINERTGKEEQVALQVEDPLFDLKLERVDITNTLIVAAAKLFEEVVSSDEAKELRKSVVNYTDKLVNKAKVGPSIDAIKKSYATLTLGLSKTEKTSDEIEGISTVEYLKTVAVNAIKNFKNNTFSDFTSYEIGAIACSSLIAEVEEDSCGTINSALYKVCEAEIIEFLADFGIDNVGFIGEAISYAEVNNRKIKLDKLAGLTVCVSEGTAQLEDGTSIIMKDRRAEITGTIVDVDGHYYVKAIKEFDQPSTETGIYINVNKTFDKYCVDAEAFQAISHRFESTYLVGKNKLFYAIVGTNAEGEEGVIACLNGRADIAKSLKAVNFDNMNIFSHKNKENKISKVLFIPGVDYTAALDTMNNVSVGDNTIDFSSFSAPIDMNAADEYANYTAELEAAADAENAFGRFDFGMPV